MLTRRSILGVLMGLCLSLVLPAQAQDKEELAKNNPVGIVSLVQGEVQFKHLNDDWQPAHWLTLVRPEDQLKTGDNGKVLVHFFADDHAEIIDAATEAKVAFKSMIKVAGGGIRRQEARDRAATQILTPYMLESKLASRDFAQANEPGAIEKEKIFLKAFVLPDAFPPVFSWQDVGAPLYRLQLFNEWNEVIYETKTKDRRFKYPYKGNFQLARNSQYLWQVLTPDDTIVVRKYPFTLLTALHTREVARAEKNFENLQRQKKLQQNHYTDMFLLYNNRKMIDRLLGLLQQMTNLDPENPMIYRALVRVYLAKGCPAHAQEALNRELQLNGNDPFFD